MIDDSIIHFLNGFAGRSIIFDQLIYLVVSAPTFKLLPIIACLVWLWFGPTERGDTRMVIAKGLTGAFLAMAAARIIQNAWSYRPRPMHAENLGFVLPYGLPPDQLKEWSSFPSDNTALALALAATVWTASRSLGWACIAWAGLVVAFPRVYAGFHYPTDIVAGAAIGVVAIVLCLRMIPNGLIATTAFRLERSHPGIFYCGSFLLLYQLVTLFDDLRRVGRGLSQFAEKLF